MELPWWSLSPGPFTISQWILLTLWGTYRFHKIEPIKTIKDFFKKSSLAAFSLGLVVLSSDAVWVISDILRWGSSYPNAVWHLILSLMRDLIMVVFCYQMTFKLWDNKVLSIKKGTKIGWLINIIFFTIWFGMAPDPVWTDYTWGIRFDYPWNTIWAAFFISHVIGRIITTYIFYTLWGEKDN